MASIAGQGWRPLGVAASARWGLVADDRDSPQPVAVLEFGQKPHIGRGGGHHLALHRQHPGCLAVIADSRLPVIAAESCEEEIAEAVALGGRYRP